MLSYKQVCVCSMYGGSEKSKVKSADMRAD